MNPNGTTPPEQKLQALQDMLSFVQNQRNAAQNEAAALAAEIVLRDRKIAELEAKLKEVADEPELPLAHANGHDAAQAEMRE